MVLYCVKFLFCYKWGKKGIETGSRIDVENSEYAGINGVLSLGAESNILEQQLKMGLTPGNYWYRPHCFMSWLEIRFYFCSSNILHGRWRLAVAGLVDVTIHAAFFSHLAAGYRSCFDMGLWVEQEIDFRALSNITNKGYGGKVTDVEVCIYIIHYAW